MLAFLVLPLLLQAPVPPAAATGGFERAAAYSESLGGFAVLVKHGGAVLFERYRPGEAAGMPHPLASGTKSFWGVAAAAAVKDGLLDLDELACDTLGEWKGDPRKSRITVRHLLSLTAGLEPASRELDGFRTADKFAAALDVPAIAEPGEGFRYGPASYCAFGELLRRKLAAGAPAGARAEDPLAYLKRRVLDPIGLELGGWTRDRAGNPGMASGARLSAREWAKFGQLLLDGGSAGGQQLVDAAALAQCFRGSAAFPRYGLTFWLGPPSARTAAPAAAGGARAADLPALYLAAGLGAQLLYVVPAERLVVVRQGPVGGARAAGEFDHAAFLRPILEELRAREL